MLICWHLEEGFNADVIVLSLHYEFSIGKGTYNLNHERSCYISCIECTHKSRMPF